jgi:tetraacyldisaccharide 4'-kinase
VDPQGPLRDPWGPPPTDRQSRIRGAKLDEGRAPLRLQRREGVSSPLAAALQQAWWQSPPSTLARALRPLSALYALLAGIDKALTRPRRLDVPVLVVGNLVVGGAGKTPTVMALVRLLRAYGWTPGVVSRGYGRRGRGVINVNADSRAAECGDEPLLIHRRTEAPVLVGSDRVAAARALRIQHPTVDIVISDDGLQHHRLARDAQVIVFDERGIGNGLLLPAGPLRERLPIEMPTTSLVLYNASRPMLLLPGWMALRKLSGVLSYDDWRCGLAPLADSWSALHGRHFVAAAGIASPDRFFSQLRDLGLRFTPLALPDHHAFDTLPWPADASDVVLTEKDAVKLDGARLGATRVWVAPLDFEFDLGFAAAIKRLFPNPPGSTSWPPLTTD